MDSPNERLGDWGKMRNSFLFDGVSFEQNRTEPSSLMWNASSGTYKTNIQGDATLGSSRFARKRLGSERKVSWMILVGILRLNLRDHWWPPWLPHSEIRYRTPSFPMEIPSGDILHWGISSGLTAENWKTTVFSNNRLSRYRRRNIPGSMRIFPLFFHFEVIAHQCPEDTSTPISQDLAVQIYNIHPFLRCWIGRWDRK